MLLLLLKGIFSVFLMSKFNKYNNTHSSTHSLTHMKRYIKKIGLYALLMGSLTACYIDPTTIAPVAVVTPPVVTPPTKGTADFTKYVAIGNSLTAGFADGGVYRVGQLVAYPNLLAQQFRLVGGGDFPQPLYSEAQKDGTGYLRLRNMPSTTVAPNVQPFGPGSTGFMGGIIGVNGTTPLYAKHVGVNNNFGVAGIKISDVLTAGYGFSNPVGFNPHFERLLGASNATSTYKDYVLANSTGTTFFSMWLGNNDVLGYATAGGTGAAMTDVTTFTTNYQAMIDAITPIASKGILVTIPRITLAAHFNVVTRTSLLATINAGLPTGSPAVTAIFIDASGTTRSATDADMFLLGAQADYGNFGRTTVGTSVGPYGLSPTNPLKDASVLDATEVVEVQTRTNELNAVIMAQAIAKNLALLDVNLAGGALDRASTTGFVSNNLIYRTSFISGGIFSLDGIHLTGGGNAIIANEMMKVINTKYGSTLPLLNTSNYKGVYITPLP